MNGVRGWTDHIIQFSLQKEHDESIERTDNPTCQVYKNECWWRWCLRIDLVILNTLNLIFPNLFNNNFSPKQKLPNNNLCFF